MYLLNKVDFKFIPVAFFFFILYFLGSSQSCQLSFQPPMSWCVGQMQFSFNET